MRKWWKILQPPEFWLAREKINISDRYFFSHHRLQWMFFPTLENIGKYFLIWFQEGTMFSQRSWLHLLTHVCTLTRTPTQWHHNSINLLPFLLLRVGLKQCLMLSVDLWKANQIKKWGSLVRLLRAETTSILWREMTSEINKRRKGWWRLAEGKRIDKKERSLPQLSCGS